MKVFCLTVLYFLHLHHTKNDKWNVEFSVWKLEYWTTLEIYSTWKPVVKHLFRQLVCTKHVWGLIFFNFCTLRSFSILFIFFFMYLEKIYFSYIFFIYFSWSTKKIYFLYIFHIFFIYFFHAFFLYIFFHIYFRTFFPYFSRFFWPQLCCSKHV